MERYHKARGNFDGAKVQDFTRALNSKRFIYSRHFFQRIREKFNVKDQGQLGLLFQDLELQACHCFEYYVEAGRISKACYRIPFNKDVDIILVLASDKFIVTIYSNAVWDNHATLNKEVYSSGARVTV